MQRSFFTLGLDLAQSSDFTALVALEHRDETALNPPPRSYAAILLERWRDRPYTDVPALVERAERQLRLLAAQRIYRQTGHLPELSVAADVVLAVDGTGVGAGVVDMLDAAGLQPTKVLITGGAHVNRLDRGGYAVPKADLVAVVQILLESRRLQIASGLPHAETLTRELRGFRYNYTSSGHMSFGAGADALTWRGDGAHDDLVLALALAAWVAEHEPSWQLDPIIARAFVGLPN